MIHNRIFQIRVECLKLLSDSLNSFHSFFSPVKLYEYPKYTKKFGSTDIVPLSGIISGKLHRIENEHKTVLEHWRNRRAY